MQPVPGPGRRGPRHSCELLRGDALDAWRQPGHAADRGERAVVADAELVDRSGQAGLDVQEATARDEVDPPRVRRGRDSRYKLRLAVRSDPERADRAAAGVRDEVEIVNAVDPAECSLAVALRLRIGKRAVVLDRVGRHRAGPGLAVHQPAAGPERE